MILHAGIDNVSAIQKLTCRKAAMLTNDAACNAQGIPSRQVLLSTGIPLVRLFSPEHGISRHGADGAPMLHIQDALTGLPVYSLYGAHLQPTADMLEGIDTVFFDLPDVGARFYTYLWTLTYMMEACAAAGVQLVVLDRPNPLGGDVAMAEGPMLDEMHCSSFLGRWSIPIRHSCTLGELASYFRVERMPGLQLYIVPCPGWERQQHAMRPGIHFVPTSPAIASAHTAFLYPGTCLLEGIQVSEGRGTPYPFEQFGAPWLDADRIIEILQTGGWLGVVDMQPVDFVPEWGVYARAKCKGIRLQLEAVEGWRPVAFGIALLQVILRLHPAQALPRLYPTVANPTGEGHMERLLGIPEAYGRLQGQQWIPINVNPAWKKTIGPFLLYP